MLIETKARAMAMMLMRTSRAIETAEGDRSTEWFMFKLEKATECRKPTSDLSMMEGRKS